MHKKLLWSLLLMSSIGHIAARGDIPKKDIPEFRSKHIDDRAEMLKTDEVDKLEKKLIAYEDSTSTQIAVLIVPTIGNYEPNEFATATGNAWGLGRSDKDNGLLVLIVIDGHKTYIATGHGAEGAMPDATCKRILDHDLKPKFKDKEYYGGIDFMLDRIFLAMAGEYQAVADKEDKDETFLIAFLVICFIGGFVCFFNIYLGCVLGAVCCAFTRSIMFDSDFLVIFLLFILGAVVTLIMHGIILAKGEGSGSSGGWSSGGSSGGGFSGGGGSFGGGGAGGGW